MQLLQASSTFSQLKLIIWNDIIYLEMMGEVYKEQNKIYSEIMYKVSFKDGSSSGTSFNLLMKHELIIWVYMPR